jgi:AcrR family transcriptional regulator
LASKHEQNRAEKRERLLKAAVEAFTEAGFDNTTVSDVVHRAGMTPSTFYNYYRDKDALRDEMVANAARRMVDALAQIRSGGVGAEEYFGMATRRLLEAVVADHTTATLLRRNLSLLRTLLDDKALRPVYAALRSDIDAAATRGQMTPIDADYAVAVFRAASLELAVVLLSRSAPDINGAVEFLTRVLGAAFRFR